MGQILQSYHYTYDVNGNRVESKETVGGQTDTTGYLVDDSGWLSHVVADFDGADAEALYVRTGDQLLGLSRPTWRTRAAESD